MAIDTDGERQNKFDFDVRRVEQHYLLQKTDQTNTIQHRKLL